jgi:hypothetical protein
MKTNLITITILFFSSITFVFTQNNDSLREQYEPLHPQGIRSENNLVELEPGKSNKLSLKLMGYVRVVASLDWGNIENTSEFIPSLIPIYPNAKEQSFRFSMDPRQSRIGFEGLYQVTHKNKLKIYIETDFYTSESITSIGIHLRQAYAAYGSFLVGLYWTAAFNVDATPNQVDFEGPSSILAARNPQIRYTFLRQKFSFAASVETHPADYSPYPDIDDIREYQAFPDVITYVQTQGSWGNLRLTGIYRTIGYSDSSNLNVDYTPGWGINFSGYVNFLNRKDIYESFYWSFSYGKGIAYYMDDISGYGYDAMPDNNEAMISLPTYGGYVAYKHAWNQKMESNIIASYVYLDNTNVGDSLIFDNSWYGAFNYMYTPLDRIKLGIEFLYGKNTNKEQDWGEGYRIQLMGVFNF